MSEPREDDAVLGALRELPRPPLERGADTRARAAAGEAFTRAFEPTPWHARLGATFGRAAVPVGLAAVVALYLTWAFSAASALVH